MAAHICVTVSGPALSFLIYENVKSFCDQEGFLVGEIISHVTDTISDSQIRGEKTETIISINSLMPIPHSMCLYNGVGRINGESLRNFLKDKAKEIIGWYSFRRNSSLVPHLRDRLLHKQLSGAVPHVSPEHFTMCLLNTSVSNGGSTHVFNHKFLRHRHSKFESLPMQIHNLGETQPEYKLVPSTTCLSDSFNNIIMSLKGNQETSSSDATLVCEIQKALQEHLRRLIDDVAISEMKVADLELEVVVLRQESGPILNEVLLPQLLQDSADEMKEPELSIASSNELPDAGEDVANAVKAVPSPAASTSSSTNHTLKKGEASASSDPFSYVTDLKAQMSRPQNSPPSSSSAASMSKRTSERGRGVGRGCGRGVRKTSTPQQPLTPTIQKQQSPPKVVSDSGDTMTTRRAGSASASPVRGATQPNNNRGAKRGGYAQAVKRTNTPSDPPKPLTRSQAANNSNSQDY